MFLTTKNLMNRFTVGQTHTHRDIMDDKEKIKEARRQIHELFANISETKEIWLDESVNHEAFNTPKQFSILMEKAIFLGIVIRDLGNMKRTLEK